MQKDLEGLCVPDTVLSAEDIAAKRTDKTHSSGAPGGSVS